MQKSGLPGRSSKQDDRSIKRSIRAEICPQMKGAVILQFLVTVPADGVAHTFHFNLRLESQSLPIRSPGQDELRLPDFPGERIAGIERTADRDLAIVTREGSHAAPQAPRRFRRWRSRSPAPASRPFHIPIPTMA